MSLSEEEVREIIITTEHIINVLREFIDKTLVPIYGRKRGISPWSRVKETKHE